MSRPYLKVTNMSYSSSVLSINYEYAKLRGGGSASIQGFSQSIGFNITENYTGRYIGTDSKTFSITSLGTASSTTYINSTASITISGATATANDNIKIFIAGVLVGNATASGPTMSAYASLLFNSLIFSGTMSGYSARLVDNTGLSPSSASIIFTYNNTSPSNNNGTLVTTALTKATASTGLTCSPTASFAGAATRYAANVTYTKLGGSWDFTFNV